MKTVITLWRTSVMAAPYVVAAYCPGVPTASQVILRFVFDRAVSFPALFAGSQGGLGVAATAETDFDIAKNGSSIGTMRFGVSGTTCTFVGMAATSFAAGDILTVVAPASPDASAEAVFLTFAGTR